MFGQGDSCCNTFRTQEVPVCLFSLYLMNKKQGISFRLCVCVSLTQPNLEEFSNKYLMTLMVVNSKCFSHHHCELKYLTGPSSFIYLFIPVEIHRLLFVPAGCQHSSSVTTLQSSVPSKSRCFTPRQPGT